MSSSFESQQDAADLASILGGKYFICSPFNKLRNSYRSPWTNTWVPAISEAAKPPPQLRQLEVYMNEVYDAYRDAHYEGGISSVYAWPLQNQDGFAAAFLLLKEIPYDEPSRPLCFFNHKLEVTLSATKGKSHYKLSSSLFFHTPSKATSDLKGGVAALLSRTIEQTHKIQDSRAAAAGGSGAPAGLQHMAVGGPLLEKNETALLAEVVEIHLLRAAQQTAGNADAAKQAYPSTHSSSKHLSRSSSSRRRRGAAATAAAAPAPPAADTASSAPVEMVADEETAASGIGAFEERRAGAPRGPFSLFSPQKSSSGSSNNNDNSTSSSSSSIARSCDLWVQTGMAIRQQQLLLLQQCSSSSSGTSSTSSSTSGISSSSSSSSSGNLLRLGRVHLPHEPLVQSGAQRHVRLHASATKAAAAAAAAAGKATSAATAAANSSSSSKWAVLV
ncbi:hypothetical protein ACSSS7_007224 [Eimeria intestinalis]